jgi:hypothetical protein
VTIAASSPAFPLNRTETKITAARNAIVAATTPITQGRLLSRALVCRRNATAIGR